MNFPWNSALSPKPYLTNIPTRCMAGNLFEQQHFFFFCWFQLWCVYNGIYSMYDLIKNINIYSNNHSLVSHYIACIELNKHFFQFSSLQYPLGTHRYKMTIVKPGCFQPGLLFHSHVKLLIGVCVCSSLEMG